MTTAPHRYRCVRCGRTFTAWAPAERHADSDRHCRIEVIVRPAEKEPDMSPKQSIAKDRRKGEKRMGEPRPNTLTTTKRTATKEDKR